MCKSCERSIGDCIAEKVKAPDRPKYRGFYVNHRIAAVLALSIVDEFASCSRGDRDVFEGEFFKNQFVSYCTLIGVDADQLKKDAIESFTLVGMEGGNVGSDGDE